jgi:hypothetical protein
MNSMSFSQWRRKLAETNWKRFGLEAGFWLLFASVFWTLSIFSKLQEYQNAARAIDLQRVLTNEISSAVAALIMLLFVRWWLNRHPISSEKLLAMLGWHTLGATLFSLGHVLLFMLLRSSTYWTQGLQYDHAIGQGASGMLRMLAYEFIQDLPLYIAMVLIISLYRRWLAHQVADQVTHQDQQSQQPGYPEIILASLGNKEKALRLAEVEWIQAAGNYASLFSEGREYLLRSTMANLEKKLDPALFQRVHRSYIVNLNAVDLVKTSKPGQQVLTTKSGREIPLGRSFRSQLWERLSLSPD